MKPKDFYTCVVCHHLNGVWRLHCQCCGAVPAMYSIISNGRELMAARGADRAEDHYTQRINLKTVELDYYAGA